MISNSVTHLRSYTNSAIADITGNSAPISPVTLRDRRRLRIEWPRRDRLRRCPKRRRLHIERWRLRIECRYRLIEWPVFHDVSHCFKSVSWCFPSGSRCFMMYHNVLHVFHDVLLCFMMFSKSHNDRRLRGRRSPQGSAITPQKSAITPTHTGIAMVRTELWLLALTCVTLGL